MKRTLLPLIFSAAVLSAQIGQNPPNGSVLHWNSPNQICWGFGGVNNLPNMDMVYLVFQVNNGSVIQSISGEYLPGNTCLNYTPTNADFPNPGVQGLTVSWFGYINEPGLGYVYWGIEVQATYQVNVPYPVTGIQLSLAGQPAPVLPPVAPDDYNPYGPQVGVTGETSYWSANNTTADVIGGNNGSWVNGSGYTAGHLNQAFVLGSNNYDYVALSGSTALSGPRTWAMWIYPTISSCMPLIGSGGGDGNGDLIGICNGALMVESKQNGYDNYTQGGPAVPANTWTHVVATYDGGSTVTFFVNGAAAGSYYMSMNNVYNMSQTVFGEDNIGATQTGMLGVCYCYMDEVYFYNSVVSTSGVQAMYQAQIDRRGSPETHIHVKTSTGQVDIKRGDLITIGDLSYKYLKSPSGSFTYSYQFDNREVANIRLGYVTDGVLDAIASTQPKGWMGSGMGGWGAFKSPERMANAIYSVTSTRAPGLLPMYFQSDVDNLVAAANGEAVDSIGFPAGSTKDNEKLAAATSIFNNSVLRWVIGPVFPPGTTKDDVMAKIKVWVNDYGFVFLQPLLNHGSITDLAPQNQLERDIVTTLAPFLLSSK